MHTPPRFSRYPLGAALLVSMIAVNAWSSIIQITGTVKSSVSPGPAIGSAAVGLLHAVKSTTTANNGTFSFSGATAAIKTMEKETEYSAPFITNENRLCFSTKSPGETVTIKLFDMRGCLLRSFTRTFSFAGRQEISFGPDKLGTGVHLISFSSMSQSPAMENTFYKSRAIVDIVDTVKITKFGYKTALLPLKSYQTDMGIIILDLLDTCAPSMAANLDTHAAGADCLASGCHGAGGAGTAKYMITACGTLYTSANGGAPVSGATIQLVDAAGNIAKLTTSAKGVFYISPDLCNPNSTKGGNSANMTYGTCDSTNASTAWLEASASKCPSFALMKSAPRGHCGACHSGNKQIHLP